MSKLIVPEGIKEIDYDHIVSLCNDNKIYDAADIDEIILPKSLEKIGFETFMQFSNLEKINFPNNLKYIGGRAFSCCYSLKNVQLNEGLEIIGEAAFESCDIEEIYIPSTVTLVGMAPFSYNNITKITVDKRNKNYSDMNCNIICEKEPLAAITPNGKHIRIIQGCLSSIIPADKNITGIGIGAFEGVGIHKIDIPPNIRKISDDAFSTCDLENITLNDGLEIIGAHAFSYNPNLIYIEIPKTVNRIQRNAFSNCRSLKEASIKGDVTISIEVFERDDCLEKICLYGSINEFEPSAINDKTIIYTLNDIKDENFLDEHKEQIKPMTLDMLIDDGKSMKEINNILKNIER